MATQLELSPVSSTVIAPIIMRVYQFDLMKTNGTVERVALTCASIGQAIRKLKSLENFLAFKFVQRSILH